MWDIGEEMKRFQREINNVFSSFWEAAEAGKSGDKGLLLFRKPLIDLTETPADLILRIELPGIQKQDIKVTVKQDHVEVRAEKRVEVVGAKDHIHLEERTYKGFYRYLDLPHPALPDRARATFREGVLEITLPKGEKREKKDILIE